MRNPTFMNAAVAYFAKNAFVTQPTTEAPLAIPSYEKRFARSHYMAGVGWISQRRNPTFMNAAANAFVTQPTTEAPLAIPSYEKRFARSQYMTGVGWISQRRNPTFVNAAASGLAKNPVVAGPKTEAPLVIPSYEKGFARSQRT